MKLLFTLMTLGAGLAVGACNYDKTPAQDQPKDQPKTDNMTPNPPATTPAPEPSKTP